MLKLQLFLRRADEIFMHPFNFNSKTSTAPQSGASHDIF